MTLRCGFDSNGYECETTTRLRARLAEAERLLLKYRFCGDDYPRDGWPDINEFLRAADSADDE